jgi:PIN domain nuclease of toxin-antitoxin system
LVVNEVLLDTHAFLWFDVAPEKLSIHARSLIQEPSVIVFVSALSAWELGIKLALGKLPEAAVLVQNFHLKLAQYQFIELAFSAADALSAAQLPPAHKDPFDRALAAQCLGRKMPIVSADTQLDQFSIRRIW